jgi:hypothetical protein
MCALVGGCSESPNQMGSDGLLQVEPLPPLGPNWSLTLDHKIGSPTPDPTGIAFDGTQLWLISGGHNASTHHLVRYDDHNFVVTREFTFDNLIEVLGTGVYGIAWDGSYIWISVSGNRNKLVAVDPDTGAIARTWASPTILGPSDLSFDASLMWIGDGTGHVFSMDVHNGELLSSFAVSAAFQRDNGIAALTNQVLVNGLFGEGLALFTSAGELVSTNPTVAGPMCLARNKLVTLASSQIVYYDVH